MIREENIKIKQNVKELNDEIRRLRGFIIERQNIQKPRHKEIVKLQKILEGI